MKALSNVTNNSIAPFMEDAVWRLHLQGVYGGDHVGVQHAVTVLHVVTLRRRHDVIRMPDGSPWSWPGRQSRRWR